LHELESFYAGYGRQSWERMARAGGLVGYEYDGRKMKPMRRVESGPVGRQEAKDQQSFALQLRGETIGSLEIWPASGSMSDDEKALVSALSGRISQILESARLFSEAQQRAAQEQILSELTSRIVRSLEPEGVLQAAVEQLRQLPGVAGAAINLSEDALKGSSQPREGQQP
jgi:hypothetical protein